MNEEQEVIVNNESGNNPFLKDGYGIWPRLKFLKEENEFLSDQEVYDGDIHKATSISFDPETPATIEEGSVIQIELVPEPEIANVPVCIWETSDETVARVNGQGQVFFYKPGEVTITASDVTDTAVNVAFEFTVIGAGEEPTTATIVNTFNVLATGGTTMIMAPTTSVKNQFNRIEIDGVEQSEIKSSYELEMGEHTVKYALIDSTTIINGTFAGLMSLTSSIISNTVTSIGNTTFDGCRNLTDVTIGATTPPTLGTNVFNDNAADRKIYVPADSVDTYKAADGWSTYAADIEAIPSN